MLNLLRKVHEVNRTSVTPPGIRYYRSLTRVDICPCYRKYWKLNTGHRIENMAIDLEVLDRKAAADDEINWVTAIFMVAFHIGAVAALVYVYVEGLFHRAVSVVDCREPWHWHCLSPSADAPRFQDHKWFEYFITVCATLALEGGPFFWVATHRVHHQNTEEGDPHSPRDGKGGRTWAGS